jgi:hypothetical protein
MELFQLVRKYSHNADPCEAEDQTSRNQAKIISNVFASEKILILARI